MRTIATAVFSCIRPLHSTYTRILSLASLPPRQRPYHLSTPPYATVNMAAEPKPLPFVYQFAAGAVAGVSEILVMYPLDVVKTRV